jgi:hypothetical protein
MNSSDRRFQLSICWAPRLAGGVRQLLGEREAGDHGVLADERRAELEEPLQPDERVRVGGREPVEQLGLDPVEGREHDLLLAREVPEQRPVGDPHLGGDGLGGEPARGRRGR